MSARAKLVLPEPRSPESVTRSPAPTLALSSSARAAVAASSGSGTVQLDFGMPPGACAEVDVSFVMSELLMRQCLSCADRSPGAAARYRRDLLRPDPSLGRHPRGHAVAGERAGDDRALARRRIDGDLAAVQL